MRSCAVVGHRPWLLAVAHHLPPIITIPVSRTASSGIAWHHGRVSNGPTEAVSNLVKRIKRVAFGITNFRNYRIRALPYAGKPNWDLLATITPR